MLRATEDAKEGAALIEEKPIDPFSQHTLGVRTPIGGPEERRGRLLDYGAALALAVYSLYLTVALLKSSESLTLDDGYYYLKIAQNLACGAGSTFDGLHPTNGYHPLWMLCLTPIFWFKPSPSMALSLDMLLQGVLMAAGAVVLYQTARQTLGRPAASLAALLWLRLIYPHALSGLEFSLHALGLLTTAYLYVTWFSKRTPQRLGSYGALGLLLSLTFLARLDALLLAGVLGLFLLYRDRRTGRPLDRLRCMAALSAPVILTCLIYAGVNLWWFGHPLPISSVIKRDWSVYLLTQDPHYRAHGWAVAKAYNLLWPLRDLRASYPIAIGAFGAPALLWMAAVGRRRSPWCEQLWQALQPYSPFILYSAIQFLAAALFYHGEMSFSPWYYVAQPWLTALLAGALFQQIAQIRLRGVRPSWSQAAIGAALASVWVLIPFRTIRSVEQQEDDARRGLNPTPFQTTARWVRAHLPPDAVIGSWNAGAIGFLSGRRVINLDGLVNSWDYYLSDRRDLCRYWRKTGVSYLVDGFDGHNGLALTPTAPNYAGCNERWERVWQDRYAWKDAVYVWSKDRRPALWRMTVYRLSSPGLNQDAALSE